MIQVFTSPIGSAGHTDIDSWDEVLPNLLLLFLFFRIFLLEVLPFSNREKCWREEYRDLYQVFLEEVEVLSQGFQVGEVLDLAMVVWTRQLLQRKNWSISLRKEEG